MNSPDTILIYRNVPTFSRKNPFSDIHCGRVDTCIICKEGGKGQCRRRCVNYIVHCQNCRDKNAAAGIPNNPTNVAHYHGEANRSGAERSKDHVLGFKKQEETNFMWKHKVLHHPEEEVSFSMEIVKKQQSCFPRLVKESIAIWGS